MIRLPIQERPDWRDTAKDYGFTFHTMYGEPYWDEHAYYQFSLKQIERDLEAPTEELHQMCLHVVDRVLNDEKLLLRFKIPQEHWSFIKRSWDEGDPSLYSRLDLVYDGQSPAKLLENNADTPTSIYETGFWQWLWLEDNVDAGVIARNADQFNSLQDKLINRFKELKILTPGRLLHFACCKDTEEDRGTVQYLEDCAQEAGIDTAFVYVEDIGLSDQEAYTDLHDRVITWLFKLYPWEFMLDEAYGAYLENHRIRYIEPPWKAVLSNKALLPLLWQMFPNHPNLLPAYFEDQLAQADDTSLVKKPIFSREGSNISIIDQGKTLVASQGPYGEEGYIYQKTQWLPRFGDNFTLIGSWLVDDQAAGISIREDKGPITQDMSRFLPHIIL